MGAVAGVLGVLSGAVSAVGAMQSASAEAQAADYDKATALRNRNATFEQTAAEKGDQMAENRRRVASIRTAYGAAGVDLGGSPLDALQDTAIEQNLDVAKIGYQGELRALGYTDTANMADARARAARRAGPLSAAAAFLGAAQGGLSQAGSSMLNSGG